MTYYKVPMLLDAFRLTGDSVADTVASIVGHLGRPAGGFNYDRAAAHIRKGYHGYRNYDSLVQQCRGDGSTPAKIQNARVVRLVAPLSAGRKIQTFDFPRRFLTLAHGIESQLGPRFFFVEDGVVKVFYLHCRSDFRASLRDEAMLACMYDSEVLQNDFYGTPADIELVDVQGRGEDAIVRTYGLSELRGYVNESPTAVLNRFVQAFQLVEDNRLAGPKKERKRRDDERQGDFNF